MKIYVRAPMLEADLTQLQQLFGEVVYDPWTTTGERFYEDEMLDALIKIKPDILITELDKVTRKVIEGYPNLKAIGDCRANPANIDVAVCSEFQIPILCTPARNAQAVAEMLVGLLIVQMRNIIPSTQWIKDNEWKEGTTPYFTWMGNELCHKKIGFVGFGAVGKKAATLLKAFDCDIYFYDPFVESDDEAFKKCEIEFIFSHCDIVSLHLPVLDSTIKMIDRSLLSKMKKDAIFINTARSAVVDMEYLLEMAKSSQISGIILDVLESEPPTREDLEIIKCPNVLLTPHTCGATYEVSDHQSRIISDRLTRWFHQEDLDQIVFNKQVLHHG